MAAPAMKQNVRTYGHSRSTTATQQEVWRLWSDPNNWSRWNTGIRWVMLEGPLRSGVSGSVETTSGSKHTVTFSDVEAPNRFRMSLAGPPLTTMTFLCQVEPGTGDGGG